MSLIATTKVYKQTGTGTVSAGGVEIQAIDWLPAVAGDDLIITDNADNEWLALKCHPTIVIPIHRHYYPAIRLPSLKIGTIDGGTVYIQLRTDI